MLQDCDFAVDLDTWRRSSSAALDFQVPNSSRRTRSPSPHLAPSSATGRSLIFDNTCMQGATTWKLSVIDEVERNYKYAKRPCHSATPFVSRCGEWRGGRAGCAT